MIVQLFKNNKFIILLLVPLLAALMWIQSITVLNIDRLADESFQMPFYAYFFNLITSLNIPRAGRMLAFFLFILQAFLLTRLNSKYELIEKQRNTYVPALIFILLAGAYLPLHRFHAIYFSNIIVLIVIDILYSSYKKKSAVSNSFNASFLIGMASFFHVSILFYIVIVWIAMIIFRHFNWRIWLVSIVGFVLPFVFAQAYYQIIENAPEELYVTVLLNLKWSGNLIKYMNLSYYLYYSCIALLIIISSVYIIGRLKFKNIRSRKCHLLNFWIFILSVGLFTFIPYHPVELIFITGTPVAYVISGYLYSLKKTIYAEFIVFFIILFIIYIQIVN